MFGKKTKRIKELEEKLQLGYNNHEELLCKYHLIQNECASLRIENNKLRAKMPIRGAGGRFVPKC